MKPRSSSDKEANRQAQHRYLTDPVKGVVSNLELWVKAQPSGQRPEDLVQWVVDNYPQMVEKALDARKASQFL